ncbi:MAG: HAMP domain-containing histidine kinase [Leptospiraceae bacterium]|nr:HAMP domain-containing histidine kinase [Leptospiraceae bacterium]
MQWTQDGISIQAERIPINSEARWPWRRYGRLQRWLHKMQARGLNVSTLEYRLPVREHRSWKRSSRFELRPVTVCMLALSSFAREVEQTDQSRYLIFVSFDRIHSPILDTLRLLTEQSRQHQQHGLPAHSAQESHAPASAHTSTAVGENLVLFQEYNQNASQAQSGYHERRRRRSDREYLRLVERFREKENNLIRITHDLRQPLTNLSLGFDRLETNMDRLQSIHGNSSSRDVAAVGDSVRRMRHQLNLLESMTHDILRVEVGQEITNEEDAYNVSALVVGIAEMYTDELERRRIVLEHNLKDDILSVKNRMAVYRIVHNLFSNAVKFCSTPGRIFVELQRHDGHFTVDIEDSGKGLHSPETFFELSRRNIGRSGSGWGIGLAAAHDMATALDGRLVARSPRHGNGARFFLVLPAVRV